MKRYQHDNLSLHGAGKSVSKGEALRVLHHLVVEDILVEDVKKSDHYGSVSSVIKVRFSLVYVLFFFTYELNGKLPQNDIVVTW